MPIGGWSYGLRVVRPDVVQRHRARQQATAPVLPVPVLESVPTESPVLVGTPVVPPNFDAAFGQWADAEATFGGEDPAEGVVVKRGHSHRRARRHKIP